MEILSIYFSYHPNPTKSLFPYQNRLALIIKMFNGFTNHDIINIKRCTKQVSRILQNQLSQKEVKKQTIDRYVAFCELYERKELQSQVKSSKSDIESKLHNHFNKFAFMSGYYPIVEAKMGNGILDTLLTSDLESALLVETKQIGFNITGRRSEAKVIDTLSGAITQAKTYKSRLSGYPNIDKCVYIILFSGTPIVLTKDTIEKNEITYVFKVIDLSSQTPSHQSPIEIDTEKLLS